MDSASLQFIGFGLAAAVFSNLSRSPLWRSIVLFLASLIFIALLLGSNSWQVLVPFAGFVALGFGAVKAVTFGLRRSLATSIAAVVATYLWLKRYSCIPEAFLLPGGYFTLGMSYIFFRILSLLVTNSNPESRRALSFPQYLLYLLNFTTLVSGPIQSYDDFAQDQFAAKPLAIDSAVVGAQIERIIRGFFKVNVLAMLMLAVQQDALQALSQRIPGDASIINTLVLVFVYPIFLYANFSGYMDIVIAVARLMRVRLPENFNRPFAASSFIEFWNRWHITLSHWLKGHVYNPLLIALMRRIPLAGAAPMLGVLCFFVTFTLVGIWHGRTSEFMVFGLLQGGGVAANKLWQIWMPRLLGRSAYRQMGKNHIYVAVARGLTFCYFAFTLFWFWGDWGQIALIKHTFTASQWIGFWIVTWAVALVVLDAWEMARTALLSHKVAGHNILTGQYAQVVYTTALGFISFLVTVVLNQPAPDVVYKAF